MYIHDGIDNIHTLTTHLYLFKSITLCGTIINTYICKHEKYLHTNTFNSYHYPFPNYCYDNALEIIIHGLITMTLQHVQLDPYLYLFEYKKCIFICQ